MAVVLRNGRFKSGGGRERMRPVVIIEVPSNLGLREPVPGKEPGVKKLPSWLRQQGFHERIGAISQVQLEVPAYTGIKDSVLGIRHVSEIESLSIEQSRLLLEEMSKGYLPLIIGGDCSILIGTGLALRQRGRFGLFYLDGHTDFMPPSMSESGGAAGMDLAFVTGHGPEQLSNISGLGPYFREEDVFCVGNREYDPGYVAEISSSDIHYVDLFKLREAGIERPVIDFLEMIERRKLDGFWLHLDVDVLDPVLMPAVDSPDPGGLDYSELASILRPLLSQEKMAGLEITILDPDLDARGDITRKFADEFCAAFNSAR